MTVAVALVEEQKIQGSLNNYRIELLGFHAIERLFFK